MKDKILCDQFLDEDSDISKSLTYYVNRFPEYNCIIAERKMSDDFVLLVLLVGYFRKGTAYAFEQVTKKHKKIITKTKDERIVKFLTKKLGFHIDTHIGDEWILRRVA